MSTTYETIDKVVLTGTTASVTLSSIPSTYTDLKLVMSVRGNHTTYAALGALYNGSGSGQVGRNLAASGSSVYSAQDQNNTFSVGGITYARMTGFYIPTTVQTANAFGIVEWYIPNYAGSTTKSSFLELFCESNSTSVSVAAVEAAAIRWSGTDPITSLTLVPSSGSFVAGSSFTLYGINRVAAGVSATGGTVTTVDGYVYHTFTASGSFTVSEPGSVEYLVVAGGGAGGNSLYSGGGGGGAGGLLSGAISVSAQTYAVTVGAGGAGATPNGGSGNNSSIAAAVVSTGGGGGGGGNANAGASGGSGGGGAGSQSGAAGGSGTPGQGNAGGSGIGSSSDPNPIAGGGGGGAAAVGANAAGTSGGNGGNGLSVWGSAYGGGGGGGKRLSGTAGTGGSGGGGAGNAGGGNGTAGTANTGGGGGGAGGSDGVTRVGAAGGSGIVIIRYPVNQ